MKLERSGGCTKCSEFCSSSAWLRCLFVPALGAGREGGRVGETVIWDGHGAFLENCSSGRFLAFIVYTPGLINVENFSISHVNAHTETCIGEL